MYNEAQKGLISAYMCLSKGAMSKSKFKAFGYYFYYLFHKKQAVNEGTKVLHTVNEKEAKEVQCIT